MNEWAIIALLCGLVVLCILSALAGYYFAVRRPGTTYVEVEDDNGTVTHSTSHTGRHVPSDRPYLMDPASGVNMHLCAIPGCRSRLRRKAAKP